MDRKEYLRLLDEALAALVPHQERSEMVRYYEEYFDEAGPQGETAVINELGDPKELARTLAAEAGFGPAAPPKGGAKRQTGLFIAMLVIGVAGLLILVIGILAYNFAVVGGPGGETQAPVTFQSVEEMDPPERSSDSPGDGRGEDGFRGRAFREVRVQVALADVTIQQGGAYALALEWSGGEDYWLSYELEGDALTVTSPRQTDGEDGHVSASVTVTVPEGEALGRVSVDTGLGDIELREISAGELSCGSGLGDIGLYWVDSGAADADTGLGDITWEGLLSLDTSLDTGMGNILIDADHARGWSYALSTSLGQVKVNGQDMGASAEKAGGGTGALTASSGMGSVTLNLWTGYFVEMPDRFRG